MEEMICVCVCVCRSTFARHIQRLTKRIESERRGTRLEVVKK